MEYLTESEIINKLNEVLVNEKVDKIGLLSVEKQLLKKYCLTDDDIKLVVMYVRSITNILYDCQSNKGEIFIICDEILNYKLQTNTSVEYAIHAVLKMKIKSFFDKLKRFKQNRSDDIKINKSIEQ